MSESGLGIIAINKKTPLKSVRKLYQKGEVTLLEQQIFPLKAYESQPLHNLS